MAKPIYRMLADRKWREYKRKIIMQRLTQMHVIPDVLPTIDLKADVRMAFGRRNVQPGEFITSDVSENPATLKVQVFDRGERLVTVVVINSDVPNVEKDGFDYRCHYVAANIPISPTRGLVPFAKLSEESQVVVPWLPPFVQKGSPYQRYSVFILQHQNNTPIDVAAIKKTTERDGFTLISFADKHKLTAVGAHMFRAKWDETTDEVMKRTGVEGVDIEFKAKKPEKLPYKKKDGARYR